MDNLGRSGKRQGIGRHSVTLTTVAPTTRSVYLTEKTMLRVAFLLGVFFSVKTRELPNATPNGSVDILHITNYVIQSRHIESHDLLWEKHPQKVIDLMSFKVNVLLPII